MPAPLNVLAVGTFLEAFRDAGYRGLPGALSELVDNALEAGATHVDINFQSTGDQIDRVLVLDNGSGIARESLALALQLGGSTRFGSRQGFGRYGIGLPGSSISQARRVDVYSWTSLGCPWWSFLELGTSPIGRPRTIPSPSALEPPIPIPGWARDHGTLVVWSACDRIEHWSSSARSHLLWVLGRTFREALWAGCELRVNGGVVQPVDPLFLRPGTAPAEAIPYGPPLVFPIETVHQGRARQAEVTARFSELPIEAWTGLSSAEKRRRGVSKGGGISVLRAGREVDFGWFFMPGKRKESYDDWWRCELSFSPELDELFGLTHTKQGIHPRAQLSAILIPEVERTAHALNSRVRRRFQELRAREPKMTKSATLAQRRDHLMEPPPAVHTPSHELGVARGLRYEVAYESLSRPEFFVHQLRGDTLRITINTDHAFHGALTRTLTDPPAQDFVELVLLAAARAERHLRSSGERAALSRHRQYWSNTLMAYLA